MRTLLEALRSTARAEQAAALLLAAWPGLERSRGQYGPEKIELQGNVDRPSEASVTARVKPGSASELGPYQAPEVAWGRGGAPAVVYLVCALLFERLAGAPPFPDAPAEALHVRKLLEPAPTLPPGAPAALAAAITHGLAPQAEERLSLTELRAVLSALTGAPAPAAHPRSPAPPRAPAPLRARKVASAVDEFPSMQAEIPPPPEPEPTPTASPSRLPLVLGLSAAALPVLGGGLGVCAALVWLGLRELGWAQTELAPPLLVGLGSAALVVAGLVAMVAAGALLRPRAVIAPPPPPPAPVSAKRAALDQALDEPSIAADVPEVGFRPFSIGPYWCFGRLGEGSMGVVYRSRHMKLGRLAAVKVLAPQVALQASNLAWFKREARLAARIRHPNVVSIYDFGDIEGQLYYIAMEHVDGAPLTARISGGPLPLRDVSAIVTQVAAGLDAAHGSGVIHRDLKPDNIVVQQRKGALFATIVDFGIARQGGAASQDTAAMVVGTPTYMSPEQASGDSELDARTDVFALGVLTYEMLTGRLPFGSHEERPVKVLLERGRLAEPPRPARALRPDLPPGVDQALERALAPEREQRFGSAGAFADALGRALGG